MGVLIVSLLLLLAAPVHAGYIQYLLAGEKNVTGAADTEPEATGIHGVVTIPEDVSAIVWPVPSGCPAGKPEWTRITDEGAVTAAGDGMALRTGIIWFTSTSLLFTNQCAQVGSEAEVWAVVDTVLTASYTSNVVLPILDKLNIANVSLCPAADVSANCEGIRTSIATLNNIPVGAVASFKGFLEEAVILQADAQDLITAQGW